MDASVVDITFAALLPLMAAAVLLVRDQFRAVVIFVVFGLTVALVWLRLGAPDVALAEAAVGAGITGVLFMRALGGLAQDSPAASRPVQGDAAPSGPGLATVGGVLLTLFVGAAIVWTFTAIPPYDNSLGPSIDVRLPESGVRNPVTAVLLNFRGYDTLLEVAVLMLAALTVSVVGAPRHSPLLSETSVRGPVLSAFARAAIPAMVLVAAYLLWIGASAPGGAFQGAAVLAGAWLLAAFAGWRLSLPAFWQRVLIAGGFAVFLATAVALALLNGTLLEYVTGSAKWWMLAIESALLVSCAAILATLVFNLVDDEAVQR